MSFVSSGTTITQSGTDTSLAGLSGLAGITVTDFGRYKKYALGASYDLQINGTLSFNTGTSVTSTYEQIAIAPSGYSKNTIKINSGGSLTIGVNQDLTLQRYAQSVPSILEEKTPLGNESLGSTSDGAGTSPTMSSVYVAAGGTFRLYGQEVVLGSSFGVSATATEFTVVDGVLVAGTVYNHKGGTLDGLIFCNNHRDNPGGLLLIGAPSTFSRYRIRGNPTYVGLSGATPAGAVFNVFGVPALVNASTKLVGFGRQDSFANAPTINFYNLANGSDYAQDTTAAAPRYHKANLYRRCVITVSDSAGTAVSGALVRISGKAGSTVYTDTTSGGGATGNMDVLLSYWFRDDTGSPTNGKTYYCLSNNTTDDFQFRVYSYGYLLGLVPTQILKGETSLALPWTLFADASITLSQSAAAALSSASTWDDVYDMAKNWKVQSANCTYPTTDTLLATANGTLVDLGSMNVVFDPSAGSAFSVNTGTNTVTIKTAAGGLLQGTKFKGFTTTGTVTLQNGAFVREDVAGARWDVSGTVYYGKHIYRNAKTSGGANIQSAVVAWVDENGNDRTFNASRVLGGLTTDASGNANGYAVWKIGSTTYTLTEYLLKYGYEVSALPIASNGSPIGSSGAYDTVRLSVDSNVTLTEANALLVSGVTVTRGSQAVNLNSNTLSDAQDNLKARQASLSDIETGVKGYLSYVLDGRYLSKSGTTYTGKSGWVYSNFSGGGTFQTGIVPLGTPGSVTYDFGTATLRFTAAGTYQLDGLLLGTLTLVNTSGGSVTVEVPNGTSYVNSGPNITVTTPQVYQSVPISGAVAGSRIQLYDLTSSTELYNGTPTFPYTWTDTNPYAADRQIRLRVSKQSGATAKKFIETIIGTATLASPTVSYLVSQEDDAVYNANAVDGSTVTGVTFTDASPDVVNINVASAGTQSWKNIYAAYVAWICTATGIASDTEYIRAVDQANYRFTNMMVKNTSSPSVPLKLTGGYAVDDTTGYFEDIVDTSGGNIYPVPDHVVAFQYTTLGDPVITGDIADIPTASENAAAVWGDTTTYGAGTKGDTLDSILDEVE